MQWRPSPVIESFFPTSAASGSGVPMRTGMVYENIAGLPTPPKSIPVDGLFSSTCQYKPFKSQSPYGKYPTNLLCRYKCEPEHFGAQALNAFWICTIASVAFCSNAITSALFEFLAQKPVTPLRCSFLARHRLFSFSTSARVLDAFPDCPGGSMNAGTYVRRSASGPSHDHDQQTVTSSTSSSSHMIVADDMAHISGSTDCLCSACHLSRHVFPRRQDGKIELPNPLLVSSGKFGGRQPNMSATTVRVGQEEIVRSRTDAELREGTSRGFVQLSGPGVPANVTESQLSFPPSIRTFKMPVSDVDSDIVKRERSQTPTIERHADRPRQSKKISSQPKTKRSWPTFSSAPVNRIRSSSRSSIGYSDPEFQNPYAEIVSHPLMSTSGTSARVAWPDPYENVVEETFPQLFDSRVGLGKRGLNLAESSSSQAINISSGPDGGGKVNKSSAAISHGHRPQNSTTSRNVSLPGRYDQAVPALPQSDPPSVPRDVNSIEGPPRVIRFNSYHNPQPDTWVSRNNVDEVVQGRSEIRLSPEQTHTGILRFQDPLMPESYPSTVTKSRETSASFQLRWDSDEEKKKEEQSSFRHSTYSSTVTGSKDTSVVQVKWDSERKRRQGYFAQEGVEKSPFRHYNKSSEFDEAKSNV